MKTKLLLSLLLVTLSLSAAAGAEIRVTKELKVPVYLNGGGTMTLPVGRTLTVAEREGRLIATLNADGSIMADLTACRDSRR